MRVRRSNAALSSYDSIMDTMTNVVAVLIIVVAVTQLSVADFGDPNFRLKVIGHKAVGKFSFGVNIEIRDTASGTSIEARETPGTAFQARLATLSHRRRWIEFKVWDDSFDVYLRARALAETAGFAVGWDAMAGQEHGGYFTGSGGGEGTIPD